MQKKEKKFMRLKGRMRVTEVEKLLFLSQAQALHCLTCSWGVSGHQREPQGAGPSLQASSARDGGRAG